MCELSQEASRELAKQLGFSGRESVKPWFNLCIFEIHRRLRLEGKPKGNAKILSPYRSFIRAKCPPKYSLGRSRYYFHTHRTALG